MKWKKKFRSLASIAILLLFLSVLCNSSTSLQHSFLTTATLKFVGNFANTKFERDSHECFYIHTCTNFIKERMCVCKYIYICMYKKPQWPANFPNFSWHLVICPLPWSRLRNLLYPARYPSCLQITKNTLAHVQSQKKNVQRVTFVKSKNVIALLGSRSCAQVLVWMAIYKRIYPAAKVRDSLAKRYFHPRKFQNYLWTTVKRLQSGAVGTWGLLVALSSKFLL